MLPHYAIFIHTPPTYIYTLSLHDALPISDALIAGRVESLRALQPPAWLCPDRPDRDTDRQPVGHECRSRASRSEEHTSELQSLRHLVCRLLLEKKNNKLRYDHKSDTSTES